MIISEREDHIQPPRVIFMYTPVQYTQIDSHSPAAKNKLLPIFLFWVYLWYVNYHSTNFYRSGLQRIMILTRLYAVRVGGDWESENSVSWFGIPAEIPRLCTMGLSRRTRIRIKRYKTIEPIKSEFTSTLPSLTAVQLVSFATKRSPTSSTFFLKFSLRLS